MSSTVDHPDINDPNVFIFYRYNPSLVAAVIFSSAFTASTTLHIIQATTQRSKFFIPFIIGGIFEVIGYVVRGLAHAYQYDLGIYITQTLLLLVAPALFAATIYMTLGRIILLTGGEIASPIRASLLTKLFVSGDVISFLVQAAGGGLMANISTMTFGKHLVVIGLLLQILFFGIFFIIGGLFHYRIQNFPTPSSARYNWRPYMYVLYAASSMILIRSVFRVIEFSGGNNGVLLKNEVFLYVFDALLMSGVMIAFNVLHPGAIIAYFKSKRGAVRMRDQGSSGDTGGDELKDNIFPQTR